MRKSDIFLSLFFSILCGTCLYAVVFPTPLSLFKFFFHDVYLSLLNIAHRTPTIAKINIQKKSDWEEEVVTALQVYAVRWWFWLLQRTLKPCALAARFVRSSIIFIFSASISPHISGGESLLFFLGNLVQQLQRGWAPASYNKQEKET